MILIWVSWFLLESNSVQFSCSVMSSSCDPVHHQFPELTQTHVHWVDDGIQPFHTLSSPSPPTFNLSQHEGFFPRSQFFAASGQSIGVSASASVLPMNIQDWFPLGLTSWISLQSNGLSRAFSHHHSSKASCFSSQPSSSFFFFF